MAEPFRLRFVAVPGDIDELGHVNNAVFVRWIQDLAGGHWHAAARREDIERFVWVVTRHEIDYRRPTLVGEALIGETWVGAPSGARFDRHVRFIGPAGETRVEARTVWALIDRATRRARRVPAELAEPFLRD